MFPGLTSEEIAAAFDAVVMQLLDEVGIDTPPVAPAAIAKAIGIVVAEDARQTGRGRYVRLRGIRGRSGRATILLRPDPREERRHWALAHEIGEHVAHRVFGLLGVVPEETSDNAREAVANQLAGRILLPTPWFVDDGRQSNWDLLAMKDRYRTASHELIARRMLENSPPIIVTIIDQTDLYFRRSNVTGRVPPLSECERRCWRDAHRHNRPRRLRSATRSVCAWPVHEEGWKREILRTEIDFEQAGYC
jgi:Zn-dependent peptidase ImmA (M78 family)